MPVETITALIDLVTVSLITKAVSDLRAIRKEIESNEARL